MLCVLVLLATGAGASADQVTQRGNTLVIDYREPGSGSISIDGEGPGYVYVAVGEGRSTEYTNVRNIAVIGSDASDYICLESSVEIAGGLKIKSGAGDDQIYISGTYGKSVRVSLGDGDDNLSGCDDELDVAGDYTVRAGTGDDEIHWDQDITVGKNMKIMQGGGDVEGNQDLIMHGNVYSIGNHLMIHLAAEGGQVVELENVSARKLTLRGGRGSDELDMIDSDFDKTKFKGIELGLD